MIRIYFDDRGKITGNDNCDGDDAPTQARTMICREINQRPDPTRQVVDLETRELRPMTAAERAALNLPHPSQLLGQRETELAASDWRERTADPGWLAYRQALRDITKAGDAAAMIAAWPLRPDGVDALTHLKADMLPLAAETA